MAANSSSRDWKYDVFLSFRGPDTRKIFVGHLHQALDQKALTVFIDTEELPKGQVLQALLKAIEDSKVSIVVFSQDYASSTWCLKEVTKIMECIKEKKQRVVPVFYQVDPAHVRYQKGKFEEAFAKHEKDGRESKEVLQRWRSALAEAATLSGWDSRDYKNDALLTRPIAEDIAEKLKMTRSSESESSDLVGMKYHIQKMENLLRPGLNEEVRTVGIWGMGYLVQLRYLEEIIVSGCSKFEVLPEIFEPDCTNLVTLSLKDCEELKSLPSTFYLLRSLRFVSLSGCSKFEVFPEISEDMEELRELHLDGTSIKEFSPSVER